MRVACAGRFNPETGERIASADGRDRYQDVFGQTLVDLARLDRRVVGITPAMPSGCSMNLLLRAMPERCFDVGIAEGHAVTFSAGLAAAGIVPFCNIYSTFMQRAFDNVIHDVAIQRLPSSSVWIGAAWWARMVRRTTGRSIWPISAAFPT